MSEPVGKDGSQCTHTHEGGGREAAEKLAQVAQLGQPQYPQDLVSLHLLQKREEELCGEREAGEGGGLAGGKGG